MEGRDLPTALSESLLDGQHHSTADDEMKQIVCSWIDIENDEAVVYDDIEDAIEQLTAININPCITSEGCIESTQEEEVRQDNHSEAEVKVHGHNAHQHECFKDIFTSQ
jgi:hypothetical protein